MSGVGCKFSDKIVYPEYFSENPDTKDDQFNSSYGVYSENCGLRIYICGGAMMNIYITS